MALPAPGASLLNQRRPPTPFALRRFQPSERPTRKHRTNKMARLGVLVATHRADFHARHDTPPKVTPRARAAISTASRFPRSGMPMHHSVEPSIAN